MDEPGPVPVRDPLQDPETLPDSDPVVEPVEEPGSVESREPLAVIGANQVDAPVAVPEMNTWKPPDPVQVLPPVPVIEKVPTPSRPNISKYAKFKKVDGATYRRVNEFLRKRTYITAREWALARLCTDFRTRGGAEMTFIGQHLPELVPFMQEPYTPQAVNQARNSFKKKVNKAGATFFYGAMCGFFTTDELDDMLFESSEVARFLLEVEGTTLDIDEEIDIEDRITKVMRGVGEAARVMLEKRAAADLAEAGEKEKTSQVTDSDRAPDNGQETTPENDAPSR